MAELTRRYVVMTMATDAPFDANDHEGVFVLKPWKDPAALRALIAYRDNCYPELARDLDAWIQVIQAGASVRGDVGRRNEPHIRAVSATAGNGAGRSAPTRRSVKRAKAAASKGAKHVRGATHRAKPRTGRASAKRKKRSR